MLKLNLNQAKYHSSNSLKNLLPDEQPREKLLKHGAESLTDAELLAILLRSGTQKQNAVDTARTLLDRFGSFRRLSGMSWQELSVVKGIGKVKALTLLASFELAIRFNQNLDEEEIQLTSPERVVRYFGPRLRDLDKEVFIAAFLDTSRNLIGYEKVSAGSRKATVVEPSDVFRMAVLNRADSIILLHNHPSGNLKPSKSDVDLTSRIAESGKMLGIEVADHIIICKDRYVSFRNRGLI